jgi:hypothetical protein
LSTAFLAAAVWLATPGTASSQPRPHRGLPPWHTQPSEHFPLTPGESLSPEQVKRALAHLLPPDADEKLQKQLRDMLEKGGDRFDPSQQKLLRSLLDNPALRKQLMEMARDNPDALNRSDPADLAQLWKNLPKIQPGAPRDPGKPLTTPPGEPPPEQPREGTPKFPEISPPKLGEVPPIKPGFGGERPEIPKLDFNEFGNGGIGELGFDPPSFERQETPRDRALRAMAAMWEQNIGPLKETPAVESALIELATHTANIKDSDGNSIWDGLAKETGDGSAFGEFMNDASKGGWSWPDFDLPSFNLGWGRTRTDIGGGHSSSSPSGDSWFSGRGRSSSGGGSSGSGLGFGIPGMEGSWLPVVLIAILLMAALIYWRFLAVRKLPDDGFHLGGLNHWPIDPRRIATRQDVVVAFEYLSVLICGPSAKMWTHNTIAEALAELATTHGETAVMLARLYELARYAPLDEPLTTAEVAEARRLVCRLAGLDHE